MTGLPQSIRPRSILAVVAGAIALVAAVRYFDRLYWADLVQLRGGEIRFNPDGDVHSLELNSPEFDDDDVAMAARSESLERLRLEGSAITDSALLLIARIDNLKELDLSGTSITNAGVPRLSGLQQLRVLKLNHCPRLSGRAVAQLHDLPSLQRLDIRGIDVRFSDLIQVKGNLPAVRVNVDPKALLGIADGDTSVYVEWHGRSFYSTDPYGIDLDCHSEVTAEWLTALKNPEAVVQLRMHAATPGAVEALRPFTRLRSVNVTRCDDRGAAVLAGCPDLRSLDLRDSNITDAGLKELTGLEHLQHMYLASPSIQGDSFPELQSLRELRTLTLICPNADPGAVAAGLPALAQLSQLWSLHLEFPITGAGALESFRNCPSLRQLHLCNCGLTDQILEQMDVLPRVDSLNLTGNPLTAGCVDTLARWPALREVYLDQEVRSTITPESVDGRIHFY